MVSSNRDIEVVLTEGGDSHCHPLVAYEFGPGLPMDCHDSLGPNSGPGPAMVLYTSMVIPNAEGKTHTTDSKVTRQK